MRTSPQMAPRERQLRHGLRAFIFASFGAAALLFAPSLRAQAADDGTSAKVSASPLESDGKQQTPITAYTYSAFGSRVGNIGAAAFGESLSALGNGSRGTSVGGGLRVWGSPIDRLTLLLDGGRTAGGTSAPTAGAIFRIAGNLDDGWAFSLLGKYKNDGFAHIEGEIETGALFSFVRRGFHADVNAVYGGDFDGQEMDGEARARLGYDLATWVRVGIDAQARYRIGGAKTLVGGRKADFVGGPQLVFGYKNFFMSLTAGPSTVDVTAGVGWALLLMGGGMTL